MTLKLPSNSNYVINYQNKKMSLNNVDKIVTKDALNLLDNGSAITIQAVNQQGRTLDK